MTFKSRFFKSHEITKFSHTYDYIDSNFDQVNPYFSDITDGSCTESFIPPPKKGKNKNMK